MGDLVQVVVEVADLFIDHVVHFRYGFAVEFLPFLFPLLNNLQEIFEKQINFSIIFELIENKLFKLRSFKSLP